jgi:hypothetical protein
MDSMEPRSEDKLYEKRLAGSLATEDISPYEQMCAKEPEQTSKESQGPAWRRALNPSLYIAVAGVFPYAAWRRLRPKVTSRKSKSTWNMDDTLGPYD